MRRASSASFDAASTPAVEPLMTSCPGALWLATTTISPVSRCVSSHTAIAASTSMPINAHIVPSRIAAIARAALDDEAHRVSGLQRMRGNGCRVLADAVTRNRDHVEVAGQRAAQRAFDEEQRGLRDFGGPKLLVIAGQCRAQIEAGRLRRGKHLDGDGEIDQPVRHTGGLAALSGKAECDSGQQDRMVTR